MPGSPAHKKSTLGLDLQGGLEVVLKAVPPKGHKLTAADLDRSVSIMRNRIDKLGVSEPEIRKQGSDQIVIQLAGVHDPKKAAELIGKTAQLELFDLEADLTGPSISAQGSAVRGDEPVRPARRAAGAAKKGTADGVLRLRQEQAARRRAGQTRAGAALTSATSAIAAAKAPARAGQGDDRRRSTEPEGLQALRRPAGDDRHHLRRRARSSARA